MSATPVPMLDWPRNLFNDSIVENEDESAKVITVPPYFKRAAAMVSMIAAGLALHAGISRVFLM